MTIAIRVILLLLVPGFAHCAPFLSFSSQRQQQQAEITAGGQVIMRLRGAEAAGQAERIRTALNEAALQGVRPGDVTVELRAGTPTLIVGGRSIVAVDAAMARAAASSPEGLAGIWARNLKTTFQPPYISVDAGNQLMVPVGENRTIRWGGTVDATLSSTIHSPEIAIVQSEPGRRELVVRGLTRGATQLTLVSGQEKLLIDILVREWAARIRRPVTARVSNPLPPDDELRRALRNAVLFAVSPAAGAVVQLGEPQKAGSVYKIEVQASGHECIDIRETVEVTVGKASPPTIPIRELMVSNYPERITEPATLLRDVIQGISPVRLLWHHVNSSNRPVRFAIRLLNLDEQPAHIHLTSAAAGPHNDEIFVGHRAMTAYMILERRGEGYVLSVPPGRMVELYDVRIPEDRIVSGLARIAPLEARNMMVEVVAENQWPNNAYFPAVPERHWQNPTLTTYRFEAQKFAEINHTAGEAWSFLHVGREYVTNLFGFQLMGNYGVTYTITATIDNPTDQPARCEIALRASGGVTRGNLWIDGHLQETGMIRGAAEEVIQRLVVGPREQRRLKIVTIPQSGSNYPVTMVMRSRF